MKIRLHNNDDTDFVDYEADTIGEIRELAHDRTQILGWEQGWSEIL